VLELDRSVIAGTEMLAAAVEAMFNPAGGHPYTLLDPHAA
jgi:hypothetical protein